MDVRQRLQNLPLAIKTLLITTVVGILAWGLSDLFLSRQLKTILLAQQSDRLQQQAQETRIRFDKQVADFEEFAKLAASTCKFGAYMAKRNWNGPLITYRGETPDWLPDASTMRKFAHVHFALIVDSNLEVKEIYAAAAEPVPPALLQDKSILERLTEDKNSIISLDGNPFLVAFTRFSPDGGEKMAGLLFTSRLNDDFLISAIGHYNKQNITALVSGPDRRVIANNAPYLVPVNLTLDSLKDRYLITGKSFFDYESELFIEFASLISVAEFENINREILSVERRQRAATALILICTFALVIIWISSAIERLKQETVEQSQSMFGIQPKAFYKGDELAILKKQFKYFIEEISKANNLLKTEIAERQQAEAELENINRRLQTLIKAAPLAITIIDPEGKVLLWNPAAEQTFGWSAEEILGHYLPIVPEDRQDESKEFRKKAFRNEAVKGLEICRQRKDGALIDVRLSTAPLHDVQGNIVAVMGILEDITDRKKLEEESERLRRLESVGILAGGIAHDFNNVLFAICGNLSLIEMYKSADKRIVETLKEAQTACASARELSARLITFAKGGETVKELTAIDGILKKSVLSLVNETKYTCEINIPANLYQVLTDKRQIEQVINNLLSNAKEAMPAGGVIKIIGANVAVTQNDYLQLTEGNYLKISVQDQGTGISEENLPKIFDPYFSTKDTYSQRGLGLGLAVCFSIVKKHEGLIAVASKPGSGTTFTIFLPAAIPAIGISNEEVKANAQETTAPAGGTEYA